MEVSKTIKLGVVGGDIEELKKLLTTWRYSIIQKRKGAIDNLNIPTTYKVSLKDFDNFEIPMFHPIAFNTAFTIDFENDEVKLTSLEKYKRISLKIDEEDMEYLKKEVDNGTKVTMIMVMPQSYKKGKHKRREILRDSNWKLHITLRKDIELLTVEEFKKFQKIAVIGVDLNSRHGIAYSVWVWDKSNRLKEEKEKGFIKTKLKPHYFQRKVLEKLQRNHGNSVKDNTLYQRINKKMQRENKDWIEKASNEIIKIASESIEKYNYNVTMISFEDLTNYIANGNNSKEVNRANNQWLRKIMKRTHQKALWKDSMKVLTYLPTFSKNQKEIKQILIDPFRTSRICGFCKKKVIFTTKNEIYCRHCNKYANRHINSARNIVRETINILSQFQ